MTFRFQSCGAMVMTGDRPMTFQKKKKQTNIYIYISTCRIFTSIIYPMNIFHYIYKYPHYISTQASFLELCPLYFIDVSNMTFLSLCPLYFIHDTEDQTNIPKRCHQKSSTKIPGTPPFSAEALLLSLGAPDLRVQRHVLQRQPQIVAGAHRFGHRLAGGDGWPLPLGGRKKWG